MARILVVTSDMAGRLNISAELCRRLSARGHVVTVATNADAADRMSDAGGSFVRMPGVTNRSSNVRVGVGEQLRTLPTRREAAVRDLGMTAFADILSELQPDLMLIDLELASHLIVASSTGVPMAGWTSMLSVWKRTGLPPLHRGIVPGVGLEGSRLGLEWAWLRFRTGKWVGNQRQKVSRRGVDRISVLRTLAKETGFAFDREADLYQWLVPLTLKSLPVLSFNALELEFPHDPVANCRYVGPVLSVERPPLADVEASRLAGLFERRQRGQSAALVYCSFGTWHKGDDRDFLGRLLAAADGVGWDLVVGLGGRLGGRTGVERVANIPDNVHLFDWAPQIEVLRHADLAVHHAGISSVNECITLGVPMVLYPFDFLDQAGNAARVSFHRLGEVGDRRNETPEQIRNRLERVISDDTIRENLDAMRAAFEVYQSENRAVRAIEQLL